MALSRNSRKDSNLFDVPTAQIFEDVDGEDTAKVEDDRVAELEQALKELRDQREEDRNNALLTQPTNWQSQVTEQPEVKPETIELPDPALDPDGYATAVQRRAELAVENRRQKIEREDRISRDIDTKVADLWADFGAAYPDIADDKDRIDYVATQVVKEATRKNIDVNRYMFGIGRDRFMKDVVKKYNSIFGETETDDDDDDSQDNPRPRSYKARDLPRRRSSSRSRSEDDEGRSAGVFGGNDGGGRTNRRVDPEDGPSMLDDIQAIQRKSGFF